MWRHDAERSAVTTEELPAQLHVEWVRQFPSPRPAWPAQVEDREKLQFDLSYSPVVAGHTIFVSSMTEDSVAAYDTATGAERWRFFAEGPVRLAPVVAKGKVYFVSDDGFLYCLSAKNGALLWKFRGGPSDKAVLGNERVISMWAARGGPVIEDGVVYFTAGVWPFMGIFIHALDAETGRVVWSNSGTGSSYNKQQHDTFAFAGVAPQGYIAATADALLIPGGRTPPLCLDRKTGAMRYLDLANRTFGNDAGGYAPRVHGDYYFDGSVMYTLADGAPLVRAKSAVLAPDGWIVAESKAAVAYSYQSDSEDVATKNAKGETVTSQKRTAHALWKTDAGVVVTSVLLQAGGRLYASGPAGRVLALDVSAKKPGALVWQGQVEGEPCEALAADGRLFVVTRQGTLYCFAGKDASPRYYPLTPTPPAKADAWQGRAADILRASHVSGGYCVAWGAGTGRLAEEVARQSEMRVVVVEPDGAKVASLRKRYAEAGLYGSRIAVLTGDPAAMALPPYVAELIVSEEGFPPALERSGLAKMFNVLRPYGGAACLSLPADREEAFAQCVADAKLANGEVRTTGSLTLLVRAGALPGTADWTQQYADAGNTACSKDAVVRAPLGVLWFGGSANGDVLPRHGHGPSPQVVGGRVFLMGPNNLCARDVYTGRPLWEVPLEGIGKVFNETEHQPGANALGSNFASAPDAVYVHRGSSCLRLDPATGRTVATFPLPVSKDAGFVPPLGYIGVCEDLLIVTLEPQTFDRPAAYLTNTTSKRLVVMDRATGQVLWQREAEHGFRHNAAVAGNGKLFCIDRLPQTVLESLGVRGEKTSDAPAQIVALDIRTGEKVWSKTQDVFGTWLGYSAEHDVLIESGRPSGDMIEGENGERIAAFAGRDGAPRWDRPVKYQGPLILHGDRIISAARGGGMFSLLTGEPVLREHPITGAAIPWTYSRQYGCGSVIGSEHLLTFRSGAAGFFDLDTNAGTGNLGGFKAGCTNNLIPADGVLNAPDYTHTCTCSYQLQTSLALAPMSDVENWTWSTDTMDLARDGRVKKVGINFGAPGDRQDDRGVLWLDYPSVGGTSADIPVSVGPAKGVRWFRRHTSLVTGGDLPWVAASGVEGATSITLTLAAEADATPERAYTVRLVFAEPEGKAKAAAERVFSVALQGRVVLSDFNIAQATGGDNRGVVREFRGVNVGQALTVTLTPASPDCPPPVLCGVALVMEE
jgi:outer membrane protein assembly factor BamB